MQGIKMEILFSYLAGQGARLFILHQWHHNECLASDQFLHNCATFWNKREIYQGRGRVQRGFSFRKTVIYLLVCEVLWSHGFSAEVLLFIVLQLSHSILLNGIKHSD